MNDQLCYKVCRAVDGPFKAIWKFWTDPVKDFDVKPKTEKILRVISAAIFIIAAVGIAVGFVAMIYFLIKDFSWHLVLQILKIAATAIGFVAVGGAIIAICFGALNATKYIVEQCLITHGPKNEDPS